MRHAETMIIIICCDPDDGDDDDDGADDFNFCVLILLRLFSFSRSDFCCLVKRKKPNGHYKMHFQSDVVFSIN